MVKKITKKAIMTTLGIDNLFGVVNPMFRNDVAYVEKLSESAHWFLEDRGLTKQGFSLIGDTTYQARKNSYKISPLGEKVGYWLRQYKFFYNQETDQVAVLYEYIRDEGSAYSKHNKQGFIYDANIFK